MLNAAFCACLVVPPAKEKTLQSTQDSSRLSTEVKPWQSQQRLNVWPKSRQSLHKATVLSTQQRTRQPLQDLAALSSLKSRQDLPIFPVDQTPRQSTQDTITLPLTENTEQALPFHPVKQMAWQSQQNQAVFYAEPKAQQSLQDLGRPAQVQLTDRDMHETSHVQRSQGKTYTAPGHFCFEKKCRCSGPVADCSHNYGHLTFIPPFPLYIRTLVFSFNNLTAVPTDDFFKNVHWISRLDLSNNGLKFISARAFLLLRSLTHLYLDNNCLLPSQLQRVFFPTGISILTLRNMDLTSFLMFSGQPMTGLQLLDLSSNSIEHLNLTVFGHAPHLSRLKVTNNHLVRITPHLMPNLRILQLDSNALFQLPQSCAENGSSLFPKLKGISFSDNKFSAFSDDQAMCFPSLISLDMSRNPIKFIVKDMFGAERFPQLQTLSLNAIQHIQEIQNFAFRNPTLQWLSLMFCNIPFGSFYVNGGCFDGNVRLFSLQLSHNFFLNLPVTKFRQLFAPLKNLQELYLGRCSIANIAPDTFSGLKNLSLLFLYGNRISDLPDNAFDSLTSLKTLSLNRNQLKTIRSSAFSTQTRSRLKHLDMSGNPFVCDCDLLWFQHWLVSSPSVFSKSYTAYVCSDLANTSVEAFSLTQQQCLWSDETYRAIIACVVVFIAVVIMVSVVYHYRWHIRLMLAFRGRSEVLRRRLEAENFDYDVFVSFAGEDLDWVQQHLMAKLETELGLRLCIHERDFVPGKNILNNIVDSVKGSKKFLMVFSRHFTHSPWCQFELDLCLGHTLDYGDALIVTCLGDVASRDLTSTMAAVLETTTYIQWRDNRDAVTSFWDRVTLSLRDIMPAGHGNNV